MKTSNITLGLMLSASAYYHHMSRLFLNSYECAHYHWGQSWRTKIFSATDTLVTALNSLVHCLVQSILQSDWLEVWIWLAGASCLSCPLPRGTLHKLAALPAPSLPLLLSCVLLSHPLSQYHREGCRAHSSLIAGIMCAGNAAWAPRRLLKLRTPFCRPGPVSKLNRHEVRAWDVVWRTRSQLRMWIGICSPYTSISPAHLICHNLSTSPPKLAQEHMSEPTFIPLVSTKGLQCTGELIDLYPKLASSSVPCPLWPQELLSRCVGSDSVLRGEEVLTDGQEVVGWWMGRWIVGTLSTTLTHATLTHGRQASSNFESISSTTSRSIYYQNVVAWRASPMGNLIGSDLPSLPLVTKAPKSTSHCPQARCPFSILRSKCFVFHPTHPHRPRPSLPRAVCFSLILVFSTAFSTDGIIFMVDLQDGCAAVWDMRHSYPMKSWTEHGRALKRHSMEKCRSAFICGERAHGWVARSVNFGGSGCLAVGHAVFLQPCTGVFRLSLGNFQREWWTWPRAMFLTCTSAIKGGPYLIFILLTLMSSLSSLVLYLRTIDRSILCTMVIVWATS